MLQLNSVFDFWEEIMRSLSEILSMFMPQYQSELEDIEDLDEVVRQTSQSSRITSPQDPPSLETTLEDSEEENYEYKQWKKNMNVSYWEGANEAEECEPVFCGEVQPWFLHEIAQQRDEMEYSDNENPRADELFNNQ